MARLIVNCYISHLLKSESIRRQCYRPPECRRWKLSWREAQDRRPFAHHHRDPTKHWRRQCAVDSGPETGLPLHQLLHHPTSVLLLATTEFVKQVVLRQQRKVIELLFCPLEGAQYCNEYICLFVYLSVCLLALEVQTCILPSRCHWHSLSLAPVNPDWFYLPGFYLSATCSLRWSQTNSRRAVKWLCACVCVCVSAHITRQLHGQSAPNFLCMLSMAFAWSSFPLQQFV